MPFFLCLQADQLHKCSYIMLQAIIIKGIDDVCNSIIYLLQELVIAIIRRETIMLIYAIKTFVAQA